MIVKSIKDYGVYVERIGIDATELTDVNLTGVEEYDYPSANSSDYITSNNIFWSSRPVGPDVWDSFEDLAVADQAWYWSERWQEMESQAAEDLATGNCKSFQTIDDMLTFLDADDE